MKRVESEAETCMYMYVLIYSHSYRQHTRPTSQLEGSVPTRTSARQSLVAAAATRPMPRGKAVAQAGVSVAKMTGIQQG